MKRYLLFGGDIYYPNGGWDDFVADGDTVESVTPTMVPQEWNQTRRGGKTRRIYPMFNASRLEWFHIIDSETMQQIAEGSQSCEWIKSQAELDDEAAELARREAMQAKQDEALKWRGYEITLPQFDPKPPCSP